MRSLWPMILWLQIALGSTSRAPVHSNYKPFHICLTITQLSSLSSLSFTISSFLDDVLYLHSHYLHMTSFVKYLEYKTFRRLLCTWQGSRRCTSRSRISVAWAPIPCAAPRWVQSDAYRNGSVAAPPSRSARTGWSLSFAHQVPMKWTIWGTRSMYNIV